MGGGGCGVWGGGLHVEISICACLAEEEAEAVNNCHSLRRLRVRTACVCVSWGERLMDSGRLMINLVK